MRRYLQGTLDFYCGIYAVINAISCTYDIGLAAARTIFQESLLEISAHPLAWYRFIRNETDHYWVVGFMLERWCGTLPYMLEHSRPLADCPLPGHEALDCGSTQSYLPEKDAPWGPDNPAVNHEESIRVWEAVESWFSTPQASAKKTAILRFHRFLPGVRQPVVSHWTTVLGVGRSGIRLHDASSEQGALHSLDKSNLIASPRERALIRIVPESIVLLQAR